MYSFVFINSVFFFIFVHYCEHSFLIVLISRGNRNSHFYNFSYKTKLRTFTLSISRLRTSKKWFSVELINCANKYLFWQVIDTSNDLKINIEPNFLLLPLVKRKPHSQLHYKKPSTHVSVLYSRSFRFSDLFTHLLLIT